MNTPNFKSLPVRLIFVAVLLFWAWQCGKAYRLARQWPEFIAPCTGTGRHELIERDRQLAQTQMALAAAYKQIAEMKRHEIEKQQAQIQERIRSISSDDGK